MPVCACVCLCVCLCVPVCVPTGELFDISYYIQINTDKLQFPAAMVGCAHYLCVWCVGWLLKLRNAPLVLRVRSRVSVRACVSLCVSLCVLLCVSLCVCARAFVRSDSSSFVRV